MITITPSPMSHNPTEFSTWVISSDPHSFFPSALPVLPYLQLNGTYFDLCYGKYTPFVLIASLHANLFYFCSILLVINSDPYLLQSSRLLYYIYLVLTIELCHCYISLIAHKIKMPHAVFISLLFYEHS